MAGAPPSYTPGTGWVRLTTPSPPTLDRGWAYRDVGSKVVECADGDTVATSRAARGFTGVPVTLASKGHFFVVKAPDSKTQPMDSFEDRRGRAPDAPTAQRAQRGFSWRRNPIQTATGHPKSWPSLVPSANAYSGRERERENTGRGYPQGTVE